MRLIIDIPDDVYERTQENRYVIYDKMYNAIRNGTPLPKGHGRLIDADVLILNNEEYRLRLPYSEADEMQNRMIDYINDDIHRAPTIIEADKGV